MDHHFVLFWTIFLCASVALTMTDAEVEQRKQKVFQATPNPSFTWTSPFALRVVFPNGQEDDIGLQSVQMDGKPVRCLFRGQFYRDPVSSVMVSGCIEDDTVTITIISKELWGRTAFEVSKGLVEEIENPYANPDYTIYIEGENEDDRYKRSIYEDYQDYEYLEVIYDSAHDDKSTVPPILTTPVKLAYDRSFKDKLGTEEAAKTYIRSVAEHGSLYLQNFSPETKIYLNFDDKINFIDDTFEPKAIDLRKAITEKFKQPEAVPLVIFCATDDSNDYMGISPGVPGKACDIQKGISIMKHRSNKSIAAMTFGHELGHIHGMRHDHNEDLSCHGTGLMSEIRPDLLPDQRPSVFSSCSISRFNKWFKTYGTCMEEGIVTEKSKLEDLESKLEYLEDKCSSLIASPGAPLKSGCPKPEQLQNGTWVCSEDGSSCHATCHEGFKLNTKAIIECEEFLVQSMWIPNPSNYLCVVVPELLGSTTTTPSYSTCDDDVLKPQNHGDWFCPPSSDPTTCHLECDPGYVSNNGTVITCHNGKWSSAPTCEAAIGLITGGSGLASNEFLRTVEIYGKDQSKRLPDLPKIRFGHSIDVVDSVILLCNGRFVETSCIAMTSSQEWTPHSTTTIPRDGHGSVSMLGKLHLLGGWKSPSDTTTEVLNPPSDQWHKSWDLIESNTGPCVVKIEPEVLMTTGESNQTRRSVVSYNVTSGAATRLQDLITLRYDHSCAYVKDPDTNWRGVLVAGGGHPGDYDLSEIYDITKGEWSTTGPLTTGRYSLRIVVLGEDILAMGGWDGNSEDDDYGGFLSSVDKFNLTSRQWTLAAESMLEPKYAFAVTGIHPSAVKIG